MFYYEFRLVMLRVYLAIAYRFSPIAVQVIKITEAHMATNVYNHLV